MGEEGEEKKEGKKEARERREPGTNTRIKQPSLACRAQRNSGRERERVEERTGEEE